MTPSFHDHAGSVSRIARRHEFEVRIAIQTQSGSTTEGWARDLSESGLGAFVGRELVVGETVVLTVALTKTQKLVVPAEVVVAEGTRYGFRFLALSAEQRKQIRAAIRHSPVIPYPTGG